MTASTVNAGPVNSSGLTSFSFAKKQMRKQKYADEVLGLVPFSQTIEIPTTSSDEADDEYFFFTFPKKAYLVDLQVTAEALDGHATPTVVFDVISETSGGTETVLINDTTVGQAGGSDRLDADGGHLLRDVSLQKLGIKIETGAATAQAGDVTLKGFFWAGDINTIA